jgi:hypothetical protein
MKHQMTKDNEKAALDIGYQIQELLKDNSNEARVRKFAIPSIGKVKLSVSEAGNDFALMRINLQDQEVSFSKVYYYPRRFVIGGIDTNKTASMEYHAIKLEDRDYYADVLNLLKYFTKYKKEN